MLRFDIHGVERGSDHRAIETEFDVEAPGRHLEPRRLWKNTPWSQIRERVEVGLRKTPGGGHAQEQADRLMAVVQEAVMSLTPIAKPPPYAKRWWTRDLTQLRRMYTHWRNRARAAGRAGWVQPEWETQAGSAAKQYHDAIRQQKKAYWRDFLAEDVNIWQVARYTKPGAHSTFDKIPPLKKGDGSMTKEKKEQAAELLQTFFSPSPEVIEDEGERPQRTPVQMPRLTMGEIERRIFAANSGKALAGSSSWGMEVDLARGAGTSVTPLSNITG